MRLANSPEVDACLGDQNRRNGGVWSFGVRFGGRMLGIVNGGM